MRQRRVVASGLIVLVVYVVAAAATGHLVPGRTRPLFDGFTPPPQYRWVNPPAVFKAGNQKALSGSMDFDLGPNGANQLEGATDDAQLLVTFTRASVPAHGNDTGLTMRVEPLDPEKLSALPAGVRTDGNAYKVSMLYKPSGAALDALTQAGNIFISYPSSADRIAYSPDGKTWTLTKGTRVGTNLQLGGEFTKAGYYEAAGPPDGSQKKSSGGGATNGLLIMGCLAVLIFSPLAVVWIRRRPTAKGKGKGKPNKPRK
ncbi:MAG TPA: hypothetical protein VFA83_09240 [Acidimicrobiales bacterium]|nr:hypothetical protein [Acidimicrobiales bacterium]